MNYYERMINSTYDRPFLPATEADREIERLNRELAAAYQMISVLKQVILEHKAVVLRAVRRLRP